MMQNRRILSIGGDAVYVEIYWDDPMQVEQPDESVVNTDPTATWLIHEVSYQNIYEPPTDFEVVLRHRLEWMRFPIEPNTVRTTHTFAPAKRVDMRDLSAITLGTAGPIGGGLLNALRLGSSQPALFSTFVPSQHFRFKKRR